MSHKRWPFAALTWLLAAAAVCCAVFLSGVLTSQATQNPSISLDMVTTGTSYDDTTNTMTVGPIDSCSSSPAPGDNTTHILPVDVDIQNVEDLIGWQIRLNYDGGKMRPNDVNFTPFNDTTTGQNISFVNLPLDSATAVHLQVFGSTSIPAAAPGPQTALIGSAYLGLQTAPVSPDTPPKTIPDDTSYSAPRGGVLAALNLQVLAGNAGQLLSMDVGTSPIPPSKVVVFTGSGSQDILPPEGNLGDGLHGEGVACPAATPTPTPVGTPTPTPVCPTPTPGVTATPTPTVTAPPDDDNQGNDDNQGVLQIKAPGSVLSGVCEENDSLFVKVRNFSDSAELVGVYLDVVPPGGASNPGGCQPGGRMLQTTVILGAAGTNGQQVNVFADNTGSGTVMFSCSNPNAIAGQSYTFVAVVDAHADDLAACGPGALMSLSCYNALCDDVAVCNDFRLSTTGARAHGGP